MDENEISKAIIVNVVLNPYFVSKANDYTASRVNEFPDVYVDCSMVLNRLTLEEATSFIKKIGADRVIFGTDYPGHEMDIEIKRVKGLGLTDAEKEKIFQKILYGS